MKPLGDCGLVEEAEIAPSRRLFRVVNDLWTYREKLRFWVRNEFSDAFTRAHARACEGR